MPAARAGTVPAQNVRDRHVSGGALGTSLEVAIIMAKTRRWTWVAIPLVATAIAFGFAIHGAIEIGVLFVAGILALLWAESTIIGVPVSAAILRRVETVRLDQPLEDAAQLLVAAGQSHPPVLDHGHAGAAITR